MKIVFVSDAIYPYLHGGKEKRLYEISTRLAKAGHDVHIYTMHWWKTSEKIHTEDGLTLHALCKYYPMYQGDRRSIKEGIMFGVACLKLFLVKFDVLDVDHMPFFPILSAWIISVMTFRRRKFFGTWHEALARDEWVKYMGKSGNIAALIERICIKLPYTITAASIRTQEALKFQRKNRDRIKLVSSGIDYKLISSIKPTQVRCNVLTVCRLVKDKNVDLLISAIAIIAEKNPSIACTIIGDGPEKQRLQSYVVQFGLEKNINFITSLAQAKDIYGYMKAADVFCLPTAREGFGIVILEALGCGTPVVTSNVSTNASRNFIIPNKNGSCVALNAPSIAEAIDVWLKGGAVSSDIAKGTTEYDWDKLAVKQAGVYA